MRKQLEYDMKKRRKGKGREGKERNENVRGLVGQRG
jgi:hypothetical protein